MWEGVHRETVRRLEHEHLDACRKVEGPLWIIGEEGGTVTPEHQCFNQDVGLELPGCWVSTPKALHVKPCPPPSD